jgi:hypothetical protein
MAKLYLAMATVLVAACVEGGELESTTQGLHADDDASPSGIRLSRVALNGVRLNGVRLNGVRLNGVRLNGVRLNGVRLNGPALTAVEGGVEVPESEFIGSTWTGELDDGGALPIRIDAIDHQDGLAIYTVRYDDGGGWLDLCDGAGALAVAGTWNYEEGVPQGGRYYANDRDFTFACRGFAIAKCVEMGYQPWLDRADLLAACTRALRADFCGDGTPYTLDGTELNIYDREGIQTDDAAWPLEAEWKKDGAACIGDPSATRFVQVVGQTPTCMRSLRTCKSGGKKLLTTELPPVE